MSVEVAERCAALELPLGDVKLPRFPVPGRREPPTPTSSASAAKGLAARYPDGPPPEATGSACASSSA